MREGWTPTPVTPQQIWAAARAEALVNQQLNEYVQPHVEARNILLDWQPSQLAQVVLLSMYVSLDCCLAIG